MLYSPSTGIAFVHVHKTGGNSVRAVLEAHLEDLRPLPGLPEPHYPLATALPVIADHGIDPDSLHFVATLCHPMSHAVSIYEYWRSGRIPEHERQLPHVAATRRLDFASFLSEVLVRDQFEENLAVGSEVPRNVSLLRRESLRSDTRDFLAERLGHRVRVEMPVANRTDHRPAASYFEDPATVRALEASYRWTFAQGFYEPLVIPPDESTSSGGAWSAARIRNGLSARARRALGVLRS